MTVIKAITYAESREAFFEKQLKRARRGLDNVVKYGTDPDACAERGEMVAFYQDALSALREQAERKHAVDAVEVVFCKDCQYRETTNCITLDLVNDDDYCSYGKRRESEVSE